MKKFSVYVHSMFPWFLKADDSEANLHDIVNDFTLTQIEESCTYRTKSYEILQEHRKGCASCNIVRESCGILFNLTVRSYIKIKLYGFL